MMKITQKYKAHPVGQGLFYTGRVCANDVSFNFIFDCGSMSTGNFLNNAIDNYLKKNNHKVIDLLVISHFDKDHISGLERLLNNGVKVKKIVAPFIRFKERLTLALAFKASNNGPDDDYIIDTIIDFTTRLGDDDTEIYLINESDGNPPSDEENVDESNFKPLSDSNNEFSFDFEKGTEELSDKDKKEINYFGKNIKKNSCDDKGVLSLNKKTIKVLDFIFYRKKIAENENKFFELVYNNFKEIYNFDDNNTIDIIKKIKSATGIKNIFAKSIKDYNKDNKPKFTVEKIANMNTTALCMLHFNKLKEKDNDTGNYKIIHRCSKFRFVQVLKDIELKSFFFDRWHFEYLSFKNWLPNTLLTSDSFLKDEIDVTPFIDHYKSYWDTIFIFQVPHHGASTSSNLHLYSQISYNVFKFFINYGIGNRYRHPSNQVINDITATGNSQKILPVHQYNGYELIQEYYLE